MSNTTLAQFTEPTVEESQHDYPRCFPEHVGAFTKQEELRYSRDHDDPPLSEVVYEQVDGSTYTLCAVSGEGKVSYRGGDYYSGGRSDEWFDNVSEAWDYLESQLLDTHDIPASVNGWTATFNTKHGARWESNPETPFHQAPTNYVEVEKDTIGSVVETAEYVVNHVKREDGEDLEPEEVRRETGRTNTVDAAIEWMSEHEPKI